MILDRLEVIGEVVPGLGASSFLLCVAPLLLHHLALFHLVLHYLARIFEHRVAALHL